MASQVCAWASFGSARRRCFDVDVGPALPSVDLLVECLAADQRLVAPLYGIIPGQLPPLRHGLTASPPDPPGSSCLERQLPIWVGQAAVPVAAGARPAVPIDRLATTPPSAYDPARVPRHGGGGLIRPDVEVPPPPTRGISAPSSRLANAHFM